MHDRNDYINADTPGAREDMEITTLLKAFFKIENIDRKKATFSKNSKYCSNDQILYILPELVIVKTNHGAIVFNKIVDQLKGIGSWKEKGIDCIDLHSEFPRFILSMNMVTCGIRFGFWEDYGNDISRLSNEILIAELQDDFSSFKNDIDRLFGLKVL